MSCGIAWQQCSVIPFVAKKTLCTINCTAEFSKQMYRKLRCVNFTEVQTNNDTRNIPVSIFLLQKVVNAANRKY